MYQNTLVVINRAHEGYRRAGLAFTKGQNVFSENELTAAQLQAINADPRLAVSVEANATQDDTSAGTAQTANVAQTQGRVGAADSAIGVNSAAKAKPAKKAPAKATTLITEQGA